MEESTNTMIGRVLERLDSLIRWAETYALQSRESDAPDQAKTDDARADRLRKARDLIEQCRR